MVDDDEVPSPPAPQPEPQEVALEHGTIVNRARGESHYVMVTTRDDDNNAHYHPVLIAKTGDNNEKVTLSMRITYTQGSILATPPGRHLPHDAARRFADEFVDSYLADLADLGPNMTEDEYESRIKNTLDNIEARLRQIQEGKRQLPILGFAMGKRSSRRDSPSYTMVPIQEKGKHHVHLKTLHADTNGSPIRHAIQSAATRAIVHNRPDTYYQKNTTCFHTAVTASVNYAPDGTYAIGDRYHIRHTIQVSGTPTPPPPGAPSDGSGLVSEGSDTPVLLEEASVASESLTEASASWDLTLS